MSSLMRTAALTAALLIAVPASAQQTATIGKEVPDIKIALEGGRQQEEVRIFRELRGSIAVFYFWRSTNTASVELLSEIKDLYREYGRKGVRFISVTMDKKEKADEILTEKEADFFRYLAYEANASYYLLGAMSDPYVALVGPRSILAWRGVPGERLKERLADLHARTNPPAGDDDWLERRFRKAERFYDQGEPGKAFTIALDLLKITDEANAVHGKAEALMAKCETAAEDWLKEAIQAERNKEYEKAARIVAEIAVRFEDPDEDDDRKQRGGGRDDDRDQSIKRQAEIEIGRMNGNRDLKKLIREARENAEGQLRNDRAADLEEDEYYVEAKHIYEQVLKEYEDTEAAKEAKRRLRRIERDPSIQKKVAERRARDEAVRWLDLADRFAAIGLYATAREYYENIVQDHPDTTTAERARQRLNELPKANAQAESGSKRAGGGKP